MKIKLETIQPIPLQRRWLTPVHLACRLMLSVIFGISGIQKAFSPDAFENTLKAYHFNSVIIQLVIPTIPLLEFALALTLLFGIVMRTSLLVTALLLGMYTVLMAFNLITGNSSHGCGCFISGLHSQSWVTYIFGGNSITIADIIRDLILMLMVVLVWITYDPKLGLDRFWIKSRKSGSKHHGQGYLAGVLIIVVVLSIALAATAEGNLNKMTNPPLPIAHDFKPAATISLGQQAPDFSLKTMDGKKYSLASYRGKIVLLEFFAIWCSNCHVEAPIINQIQKEFPTSQVQVLSVIASPYSKDYETSNGTNTAPYTVKDIKWFQKTYQDKSPILMDPHFKVTNEYIRQAYPNLVIIDPKGLIKASYIGTTSFNQLSSAIQSLLQQ